jgi:hypothetical protein
MKILDTSFSLVLELVPNKEELLNLHQSQVEQIQLIY